MLSGRCSRPWGRTLPWQSVPRGVFISQEALTIVSALTLANIFFGRKSLPEAIKPRQLSISKSTVYNTPNKGWNLSQIA